MTMVGIRIHPTITNLQRETTHISTENHGKDLKTVVFEAIQMYALILNCKVKNKCTVLYLLLFSIFTSDYFRKLQKDSQYNNL